MPIEECAKTWRCFRCAAVVPREKLDRYSGSIIVNEIGRYMFILKHRIPEKGKKVWKYQSIVLCPSCLREFARTYKSFMGITPERERENGKFTKGKGA